MYGIIELNNKLVGELKEIAKKLDIPKYEALKKQDLMYKILDHQAINPAVAEAHKNETAPVSKPEPKADHKHDHPDHKPHEHRVLRPRKPRPESDTERPKVKQEQNTIFNDDDFNAHNKVNNT